VRNRLEVDNEANRDPGMGWSKNAVNPMDIGRSYAINLLATQRYVSRDQKTTGLAVGKGILMKNKVGNLRRHNASGLWYVRLNGKAKYLGSKLTTKEEAEKMRDQLVKDTSITATPSATNQSNQTVADVLEFFLRTAYLPADNKNYRDKKRYVRQFIDRFGGRKVSDVRKHEVADWIKAQPTWNTTTKSNAMKHISSAWNWLVDNGYLASNPVKGVKRSKELARGQEYIISAEEFSRLLPLVGERYKPIAELCWLTGCRPSEILSVTKEEYFPQLSEIHKKEFKTDEHDNQRVLYLNKRATEIMEEAASKVKSGRIFSSKKGGTISVGVFRDHMTPRFKRAGITHPCVNYSFRHSFANRHLRAGIPPQVVCTWLGNSLPVFMKHYAHIFAAMEAQKHLLPE
jgi:integrase